MMCMRCLLQTLHLFTLLVFALVMRDTVCFVAKCHKEKIFGACNVVPLSVLRASLLPCPDN